MSRILIYIYIFAALIISVGSLFKESYPSLFWIELFAPHPGDKYPVSLVWLISFMSLLLPLLLLMFILKLIRNRKSSGADSLIDTDNSNKSGIHFSRIKQMENRLISSPIFINSEQKGRIDSGKTAFVALDPGTYEVTIGGGSQRSELLVVQVEPSKHAQVEIQVISNRIRPKYVARNV
jgi:hypothetical protein